MVEEDKALAWSPKDGLIIVPFFASGLALTWEVGFFLRIKGGAFGLFSIAEHVTFALQALPVALSLVALVIMGSYSRTILGNFGAAMGLSPPHRFVYENASRLFWLICFFDICDLYCASKARNISPSARRQ